MNSDLDMLKHEFEEYLAAYLVQHYRHEPLGPIITYALSGQGKRVRPLFCMLAAIAHGARSRSALAPALALEMVHTYSLVHDDMPCMDNDDYRRGRLTTHKMFGDDWALLAGDGILTDAFSVLSEGCEPEVGAGQRLAMVQELAHAAGSKGMVEGQALDIYWTGRSGAQMADLNQIHTLKTGALLGAACALGALAGGAEQAAVERMREFGRLVGLAFQIKDDIIDQMEGTGKTVGKDLETGKLTYLTSMSCAEAEQAANKCTSTAIDLLAPMGQNGGRLKSLALSILERTK